jgi:hypothetical protein
MVLSASRILLDVVSNMPAPQGPTPVPSGPAASTEDDEAFWPILVAGLIACGLFAWSAALVSCYQVRMHIASEFNHESKLPS